MAPILEVQNLVKKDGDFAAVDGVSFAIEQGEIFSLLGPSGAGKTTTISVLSCLLKPTSGDAIIGGHSVVRDSLKVREVSGVVAQDIALYNMLSVHEYLIFWGRLRLD
jgi:ABC-2 type transport system ATP-binding protein